MRALREGAQFVGHVIALLFVFACVIAWTDAMVALAAAIRERLL